MSIIHVEEDFAIIDEQEFQNKIYSQIGLQMHRDLFEINSKFMPDSQFDAIKKRGETEKKRKRKRKADDSDKSEHVEWIQKMSERIRRAGEEKKYFGKVEIEEKDNNKEAREIAKRILEIPPIGPFMTSSEQVVDIPSNSKDSIKIDDYLCNGMISNWIRNPSDVPKVLETSEGMRFVIPPRATFHIGDVGDVEQFSRIHDIKFDLIIADPPWFCQSVKRKKTYQMDESCLNNLNLSFLASPDALIVFWLTNRSGINEEMEKRLEEWEMEVVGRWKWLKVTKEGVPVADFDKERHKIPFESLVLARRKGAKREDELPEKFVFASIPMSVHSHKPPLLDLLRHFHVEFSNPLELFARSLLPGTHCIGFEPLLLQSDRVFLQK